MTATDELRRLLDERRVEYKDRNVFGKHVFHWGKPFHGAMFTDSGEWTELVVENATPEQAVDATLGRGTCRDMGRYCFTCSECGWTADEPHHAFGGFRPNYCPNCGKVVRA